MIQYLKSHELSTLISFNPNTTINKKTDENQDPLKVKIKTPPGGFHRETLFLYVMIFNAISAEELFKFTCTPEENLEGSEPGHSPTMLHDEKEIPIGKGPPSFATEISIIIFIGESILSLIPSSTTLSCNFGCAL